MTIPYALLKLQTPVRPQNPTYLRGFFANRFKDLDILHNHTPEGKNIQRYPLIQYKKLQDEYVLLGLKEEAVGLLKKFFMELDELVIKDSQLQILSKELKVSSHTIVIAETLQNQYKFCTGYIALNQEHRDIYYKKADPIQFLNSILTGNILSFLKNMQFFIKEQINTEIFIEKTEAQQIKNIDFMVFHGSFKTNISLPDYIGLGKFVSRGFGTIKRC